MSTLLHTTHTQANALFACNQHTQVPDAWAAKAYPSLKPLSSWVNDLLERCRFIQSWVDNGTPCVYWIPGFFFPQVGVGVCVCVGRVSECCRFTASNHTHSTPSLKHYFPRCLSTLQAFLTGTLQNFARKNQYSIDTVSFSFHVLDQTNVGVCVCVCLQVFHSAHVLLLAYMRSTPLSITKSLVSHPLTSTKHIALNHANCSSKLAA